MDDPESPLFGQPVEPFQAAVDRLWVTDSPDAKFGSFDQTDVKGHLETYGSGVRTLAAIAQLSPHVLLGDLVNLSADALAAAEAATQRKIGEYETIFGESWEQTLRLAALAAGDPESARDLSAQVRWRDTEARSLAAAVDALGKMVTMLAVPAEAAWERIPGVTDQDIERWRGMRRPQTDSPSLPRP
ncbi:phage portal protein [Solwaraspora sp. WMMD791]|uniref:phage portal protein n=1 Tax=Solwaraspora sp. WMMD791 TaxID=3016086 RepID=UPI002499FFBB|nr:phage portal protein [Solwaraspora sp. WMMD791]WFE27641.1 phage portal protein [Solwaraspora sp. WMMD791]WFE27654.1 phage portal protein [Solwaraspora sp. WMMD791]